MKDRLATFLIALTAAAVALCAGYSFGKNDGIKAAKEETVREKEAEIAIFRGAMEKLNRTEDTTYVIGHKSPDSDTVCSAIAWAELMNQLGYHAVPAVTMDINRETAWILNDAGVEVPMILEDAAGHDIVLVDHSEYSLALDALEDANVLMVIDHHGVGTVRESDPMLYIAAPVGATASIIWHLYREFGVEMDQKTARILLGAILSDTSNFKSGSVSEIDTQALAALSKQSGVADLKAYYENMHKAKLDVSGMSNMDLILSDYKEYEFGSYKVGIGAIEVFDEPDAMALSEGLRNDLLAAKNQQEMDFVIAMINVLNDELSLNVLVASDPEADKILTEAFPEAEFNGTAFIINPGGSRKKFIVPRLDETLASYPKE